MPVGGGLLDIVVCVLLSYRWSCDPGLMFIWCVCCIFFQVIQQFVYGLLVLLYLTESTTVQVDDVHVVSIVYA